LDNEELGRYGKDVIDNPAFQTAFENIKSKLIEAWTQADSADTQLKESAWAGMKLLEKIKWELEYFMEEGNIDKLNRKQEEADQKIMEEEKERKRKFLETPLPGTRLAQRTE